MDTCKKYKIITYGCQMNIHESEKIAGILEKNGYKNDENVNNCDIVVFNTCCIRENAEDRAEGNIGALKKLKKRNKNLIIAVGGCMTQQKNYVEKLYKEFPFLDIIFGTHNLEDFEILLNKRLSTNKRVIQVLDKEKPICETTPKFRTSYPNAWINITYGCNNFCTYCIVPYVRGRERSRKIADIVKECKELVDSGYKEITLLGQNVNSYGKDLENASFSSLIDELSKIDGEFRLRFMTNHPKDLTEDMIISLSKCKHYCHSIHLPVQAGSNRILKLMNRHYTREDYLERVSLLRKYISDIAITTDIMVGFPTETEEDFLDTVDLCKTVEFSGAFTFIYSKRNGTPAAKMDGQIPYEVSRDRITRLINIINEQNRLASTLYKGKVIEILCEGFDEKKKKYLGRDKYGRMAYFESDVNLIGKFVNVLIEETGGISLLGGVVK
jgi:tRNA-2-methylthio-N6-dimethylallyladenosine synthase